METPNGFSWVVDEQLGGMRFPSSPKDYQLLVPLNVGLVICLNEIVPSFVTEETFKETNEKIDFVHFPIDDYRVPSSFEAVKELLEPAWKIVLNGKGVVMHCMAGLSRTGMILSCFLILHCKKTAEEAVSLVNEKRSKKGRAVMTFKQEDFVKGFESYLQQKSLEADPR